MARIAGSMAATLRGYWAEAEAYQKLFYAVAAFLLVSALFHLGVLAVSGGSLLGNVSWRKPILFGEAFGLTSLSIGWVMTFLPKRRKLGWLLAGAFALAAVGEVFLITMQQWRGVPSHFNISTPFNTAVFAVMGMLVVLAEIVILSVALWSFFSLEAPRSLKLAIRFGMVLLAVSQVLGNLIIANGGKIYGVAGAMKVPHSLALHAVQVLPLLAFLLLFTEWSENRRTGLVAVAAVGYAGLIAVAIYQTFSGLAPFDLSFVAGLVLGVAGLSLTAAYATAAIGLRPFTSS